MKKTFLKRRSLLVTALLFILVISIASFSFSKQSNENQDSIKHVQAAGNIVWRQFDGNAQKSAANADPYINKSTVTGLKKVWQTSVSSDGSPVYLSGVTTSQGVKNLVYVTTKNGGLIAFDGDTGKQVWSKSTSGGAGVTTSSPAIGPNSTYIYNYGNDGKVHKYDVGTGKEETANGWPLTATIIPNVEKGSSALAIGNGYLYVATSAYVGDAGQYVGHIVAKNLTSGAVSVFNTLCANNHQLLSGNCGSHMSGVWSRPGAVVDPNTGNVFIASGNGPYAPPNNLADSVIELTPNLSKIVDTYTPTNFQQLQNDDADLGSTDVAIIPSLEIGVQGGKDDKLRVLNLKNLSGQGGPDHTGGELQSISVNCNIFSQPIVWNNNGTIWVFVTDMCNNLYGFNVNNKSLQQVYKKSGSGGSSPLIVNGVLFVQSSGSIKAVDPTTGNILWSGNVGSMHWQSPAVINGHVYVLDNSNLTAFAVSNISVPSSTVSKSPYITPTLYCLSNKPCVSTGPSKPVAANPSGTSSNNPGVSTSVPLPSSGVPLPSGTTGAPGNSSGQFCANFSQLLNGLIQTQAQSVNSKVHIKCHSSNGTGGNNGNNGNNGGNNGINPNNGWLSKFVAMLIQLIMQILQLCGYQPSSAVPVPSVAPSSAPSSVPSSGASTRISPVISTSQVPSINQTAPSGTQTGNPATAGSATCPNIVDPAYFGSSSYWTELLQSKATPATVGVIFNPASGPGSSVDQAMLSYATKAKAAGIPLYAYVDTAYARDSATSVESEVATYKKMYGVTNIMFDEMSSNSSDVAYYQGLINYVHTSTSGSKVILNPGTYPAQAYMQLDATFNVFEGPYTSFVNDTVPSYVKTTPASKMSVVVYATPATDLANALKLAQQRNAGTVYITDNTNTGNPYNTLPAYWATELSQITASCKK